MRYKDREKREEEERKRNEAFEDTCKLYSKSESWEEFQIERTLRYGACKTMWVDPFWRFYVKNNNSKWYYYLKFNWIFAAIPLIALSMLSLCVSGTMMLLVGLPFVLMLGLVPFVVTDTKFSNVHYKIEKKLYDLKNTTDNEDSAYINSITSTLGYANSTLNYPNSTLGYANLVANKNSTLNCKCTFNDKLQMYDWNLQEQLKNKKT